MPIHTLFLFFGRDLLLHGEAYQLNIPDTHVWKDILHIPVDCQNQSSDVTFVCEKVTRKEEQNQNPYGSKLGIAQTTHVVRSKSNFAWG